MVEKASYFKDAGLMSVVFKEGQEYLYKVPETVYNEFMGAESKGKYLNSVLKRKYPYFRPAQPSV